MAKARPPRHDARQPAQQYAFFISHVAENTEEVSKLKAEIARCSGRGGAVELSCFLDRHNWEIGNDNGWVIRDKLLRSEFMVAWITPAYLGNRRGWIWFELCYAEQLESRLSESRLGVQLPYIAPVFRGVSVQDVERTPWLKYWQRAIARCGLGDSISTIARDLVDFHAQEIRKRTGPPPAVLPDLST
jgi:hypothetical protein